MSKSLTEQKVLKKLGIDDFRHLTKDKVIMMASMLDKMDPEVAKKALEQFPDFAGTMKEILSEYKNSLDKSLHENSESVKSYYDTCDAIIATLRKELENENIEFEERKYIIEKMAEIAKMKGDKDSENKRFIVTLVAAGLAAVGITAEVLLTAIGGNTKVDLDDTEKPD